MDKYKYPKDQYPCSPNSFSSTLLDSIYQANQEKKSRNFNSSIGSSCYGLNNRPKPIRISKQEKFDHKHQLAKDLNFYAKGKAKQHDEDGFKKTKSRALKIYRELKKVKQPISPGGRLSSFLNSLFTNGKKLAKDDHHHHVEERKLKSPNNNASTNCSSFSRSCLSNKNIIISSPCGHIKNLDMDQQNVDDEAIKGINRKYIHELKFHKNIEMFEEEEEEEEEDEDEDEDASCASSDLFELDNFSSIGLMELPVYETTNLASTNLAINANGN
ncbi:hypothetical protein HAX54_028568 [Datura stramonium]|uniref:Protein BIG GRAIN 1-like E n=1 Tax=Datura stramonium TaxID=4076 RepID=A0ABS8S9Q0_DATST|nr:hypothetical protein [Datura stramonium]